VPVDAVLKVVKSKLSMRTKALRMSYAIPVVVVAAASDLLLWNVSWKRLSSCKKNTRP